VDAGAFAMLPLPPGSARWCVEAGAFAVSWRTAKATRARRWRNSGSGRSRPACSVQPLWPAVIHVALAEKNQGEKDQALDRLQMAFDDRSAGLVYLKVDPAFDAPRGDSRFAGLLPPHPVLEGPSALDGRSKGTPVLPLAFLDLVRFLRMQSGAGRVSTL
jgi:hypothetical protein